MCAHSSSRFSRSICSDSGEPCLDVAAVTSAKRQDTGSVAKCKRFYAEMSGYFLSLSGTGSIPGAPARRGQINATQQQRQLLVRERDLRLPAPDFRPPETAPFKSLSANPKTASIPEQKLQPVPLRIREKKHVAAQRITLQPVPHQSEQAFEALAHVGGSRGDVDAGRRSDTEHPYASSAATTCWSVWMSKPLPTSTRRPRASTTTTSARSAVI